MISPVLLHLGPFEIRWYGVIFALMFLIGGYMAAKLAKYRKLKKDDMYDFLIYLIPLTIIFARLAHIFIYNYDYYIINPIEMFKIWKGGVSIHGGVFGGVLGGWIFCKRKNIKFYDLADVFLVPLSFGIIFGRIGNFINQELYGRITNLPWGVKFDNVEGIRHPSQIYEAIAHLALFIVLFKLLKNKNLRSGFVFWSFITLYSFLRFFAEFFREAKIISFGLTMPQLISIPLFLLGLYMLFRKDTFINSKDSIINKDGKKL